MSREADLVIFEQNDKSAHTSKKTNISTVLGPRRMNAGVHPLNKNMGPSFCNDRRRTSRGLALPDYDTDQSKKTKQRTVIRRTDDIKRDFITSAGEQMARGCDS